tara:strand:- start:2984 stop:3457 length:474 start_codon:yes stop_codon:yes gene_type:complete
MKEFQRVIIVVLISIAFLALMDIQGFRFFEAAGIDFLDEEFISKAQPEYMKLFWFFALAIGVVISYTYFIFRKDKSEAIAIFAVYAILIWSGWEDIFFYIFQGKPIPEMLGWLMNNEFISRVAMVMGKESVTREVLWNSAILGGIASFFVVRKLKKI